VFSPLSAREGLHDIEFAVRFQRIIQNVAPNVRTVDKDRDVNTQPILIIKDVAPRRGMPRENIFQRRGDCIAHRLNRAVGSNAP
jgi:hypothetical protein